MISWKKLIKQVRKNYPSFLLGIATVVVATFLVVRYTPLLTKKTKNPVPTTEKTVQMNQEKTQNKEQSTKTYVVQEGDSLWSIAEAAYGSGFNATDIAQANQIANPSIIDVGQKLMLPDVAAKVATKGEITPEAASTVAQTSVKSMPTSYTVQHGDYLWKIAQDIYGDGEQWVVIAQANNLAHPNLIHAGNVLVIPRSTRSTGS